MKILQINKFYYLRGGAERYQFDLSAALKRLGHTVIDFSMQDNRNWPSRYSKYFIDEVSFAGDSKLSALKFIYNWQAVRNLRKLIKTEKPEVAHLHNIAHQLTPAIIKVLKEANIPVVQTLHDYKLVCPNYRLFTHGAQCERCLGGKYYNCAKTKCMHNSRAKSLLTTIEAYWNTRVKRYYDLVDLFIAPSKFMSEVVARGGIKPERVKLIYNFTDLPENKSMQAGKYLLYFGRLSDEKGIESLVRAMAKLPQESLKIVGLGPLHQKLKNLIEEQGLTDRVELLGAKQGNDLIKVIDEAKAVVFPSVWPENMPISLIEAMRRGRCVVVSRVGGMPELVEEGVSGLQFVAGDEIDLVKKLESLAKLDLAQIGLEAKRRVADLTSKKHVYEIINVYDQLISANIKQK